MADRHKSYLHGRYREKKTLRTTGDGRFSEGQVKADQRRVKMQLSMAQIGLVVF